MNYTLYTDGGARGNPGPAAIGVVIINDQHKTVREIAEYIGETTNNQAEYKAVIRGLAELLQLGATDIVLYMDSELIVKQLQQLYKVRHADLIPLFTQAWNLLQTFSSYAITHVPREKNKHADILVNQALDRHMEK